MEIKEGSLEQINSAQREGVTSFDIIIQPEQADTIAGYNHLNYDDYLDLYLRAQDAFTKSTNIDFNIYGLMPTLVNSNIDYKKEIPIGEKVTIKTFIQNISDKYVTYGQSMVIHGETVSLSQATIKFVEKATGEMSKLPDSIRTAILTINPAAQQIEDVPRYPKYLNLMESGENQNDFDVTSTEVDEKNNLLYPKYLEYYQKGHLLFLKSVGLDFRAMEEAQSLKMFIVNAEVGWNDVVKFGDKITLKTCVSRIGRSSLEFQQIISCNGKIVSSAKMTAVFVDKNGKTTAIPEAIRAKANL